ncbi:MAG: hypothetical protein ACI8YQ_002471, partial [Polaribacter sp.]
EVDYDFEPKYAKNFPKLTQWVLLRDFDGDGAMDIFSYSDFPGVDGFLVYKGFFENNELHFERFNFYDNDKNLIYFPLPNGIRTNLYVSTEDYPAVDDIDYDGDLDIITFGNGGGYIYWYKNTSVENGFGKDSLHFVIEDQCLGRVYESGLSGCLDLSPGLDSCASAFQVGALQRHAGSTLLLFDEDNDGDKELMLGDVNGEEILLAVNGGDSNSPWYTDQDCAYPSYNESAYVVTFPASFFIDVNNDGNRDLLVSSNKGELGGEDFNCVHYYRNTNTDESPIFEKTSERLFVDEMLDMGSGASPTFADFNADGLLDLLIGNETYFVPGGARDPRLTLFYNIGTNTEPAFEMIDDDYLTMSDYTLNYDLSPELGDMDNDGDMDLVVGEEQGQLFYFENTAGPENPISFGPVVFPWMNIDATQRSTPEIIDLDRDGLNDLVIGVRNGYVNFYKNIGSSANPLFEPDASISPNVQFLGGVDTRFAASTGNASPIFVEYQNQYSLYLGTLDAQVMKYENIDDNLDGLFTFEGNEIGAVIAGERTHIALRDLTNSGTMEMVIGNRRGGISIYHTDIQTDTGVSPNNNITEMLEIKIKPNPASDRITFTINGNGDQKTFLRCYDNLGRKVGEQSGVGRQQIMDISRLAGGMYYCKVTSGELLKVVKFMVE